MTSALWLLAIILVVAGVIGVVVPAVPGTLLVFLGLLIAAWADGFQKVGVVTVVILAVLTLMSYSIDFVSTYLGVKRVGASRWSILGGSLGMLVGLFFGIPGILLGPFVGALVTEWFVKKDLRQAGKAGLGSWLGLLLGTLLKLAVVFIMIGIFVLSFLL
jgi:uncharacterized protein YqgC (DUF456 family)